MPPKWSSLNATARSITTVTPNRIYNVSSISIFIIIVAAMLERSDFGGPVHQAIVGFTATLLYALACWLAPRAWVRRAIGCCMLCAVLYTSSISFVTSPIWSLLFYVSSWLIFDWMFLHVGEVGPGCRDK